LWFSYYKRCKCCSDLLFIKAGTINNIKSLRPIKEIWTDHKLDCITINGIKEKYKTDGK